MFNLRTVALAAMIMVVGAGEAFAEANCWCLVSINNLTNLKTSSGVIKDYGTVGGAFTGITQQSDNNQTACNTRCTQKASPDTGSAAIAASACSAGASNGTAVRAWSKVGTREYKSAQQIGTLIRANAVYSCPQGGSISGSNCVFPNVALIKTCPAGWMANPTNVVAGITTDGNCKRQVPGCQLTAPVPSNGTQISGYGFTWGNGVYQMSNASNGGAPLISCPTYYTVSGNNCIRASYAATLTTPAICKF